MTVRSATSAIVLAAGERQAAEVLPPKVLHRAAGGRVCCPRPETRVGPLGLGATVVVASTRQPRSRKRSLARDRRDRIRRSGVPRRNGGVRRPSGSKPPVLRRRSSCCPGGHASSDDRDARWPPAAARDKRGVGHQLTARVDDPSGYGRCGQDDERGGRQGSRGPRRHRRGADPGRGDTAASTVRLARLAWALARSMP